MPVTPIVGSNERVQPFTDDQGFSSMATGLTKREAFAMAAMQGILVGAEAWVNDIAKDAVTMADALLKELDREIEK